MDESPLGLTLPPRARRGPDGSPRRSGRTMMMDTGLPLGTFTDVITSHGQLVDVVKFGWATSVVDPDTVARKVGVLRDAGGIAHYLGGTLLERVLAERVLPGHRPADGASPEHLAADGAPAVDRALREALDAFTRWCEQFSCPAVEVSDGTVEIPARVREQCIRVLSQRFEVYAEVGQKDQDRADAFAPEEWVQAIAADLATGAAHVVTEARESGRSGIARRDGSLRTEVLDAITGAGIDTGRLLFEAPTKELQVFHVRAFGPGVNLGNIAPADLVGLETLRLGLRSDTLLDLLPARTQPTDLG